MLARYVTVAAALLSLVVPGQTLGAEPSASGLWQAVDDDTHQPNAWFLIRDGGGGIYTGAIVRMFLKPGEDPNIQCDKCVDDRRNKPWMGLEIIRGMKREGMKYTDGTILDPRDGNIYSAQMTLTPDGQTPVVRGYLGISLLGKNQYWTRLPDSAYSVLDPSVNPSPPANASPAPNQKRPPAPAHKSELPPLRQ